MLFTAKVGEPIYPEDPASPTVTEILIDKHDDSDMNVTIIRASDGRWMADFDDSDVDGFIVADTAEELATRLWHEGRNCVWVAEAMYRIGWLTLNRENLRKADTHGWRQRDLLAPVCLAEA
jgi:hypothetical protein